MQNLDVIKFTDEKQLKYILTEIRQSRFEYQCHVQTKLNLHKRFLSKNENGVCVPKYKNLIKLLDYYGYEIQFVKKS